jgi:hypothetical protein
MYISLINLDPNSNQIWTVDRSRKQTGRFTCCVDVSLSYTVQNRFDVLGAVFRSPRLKSGFLLNLPKAELRHAVKYNT